MNKVEKLGENITFFPDNMEMIKVVLKTFNNQKTPNKPTTILDLIVNKKINIVLNQT